jgi:hypothetical protein
VISCSDGILAIRKFSTLRVVASWPRKIFFGDSQANPRVLHVQNPFFPAALRAAE